MENKTTTVTCHGGGGGGGYPFDLLHFHLPEEVMIEILARLPIESLLRFKCVCKYWSDLIQTSYFIHLHATTTSSKFGTFILRTEYPPGHNRIFMLSEYERSEYGDWYRCSDDGSWHKLTSDEDGSRHKFSGGGGGGGDWHWDNTNYGWYRCTDGKFIGGYWHWDNTNCGWYWVSDGDGGNWHWDNTYCGWYWVSHGGDWHWDNTNCGWYWGDWLWDDTSGSWYWWVGDDQDEVLFNGWVGDDDHKDDQEEDDEVFKVVDDGQLLLLKVDDLELPSWYKGVTYGKVIAGSCNGLICLHDTKLREVSLWNPATRQFRILPKPITIDNDDSSNRDFVALGFDVKTKDYKVLLITFFTRVIQVYSLSTDSWRLFECCINSQPAEPRGIYMNGSCFFVASVYHPESNTSSSRFINSFDFTTEIFTTVQLPHDDDHGQNLSLHCLGGGGGGEKMALFTTLQKDSLSGEYEDHPYDYFDNGYVDCDIWVLRVNKDESWTKLHSFQIENRSMTGDVLPIGISNDGKYAFLETTEDLYEMEIQLYNLVTNKEVKLDFPLNLTLSNSKVYVHRPSLVSVISGNGCCSKTSIG